MTQPLSQSFSGNGLIECSPFIGLLLGTLLGFTVGENEGCDVGEIDGKADGDAVGCIVGCDDGGEVGDQVSAGFLVKVGSEVGLGVMIVGCELGTFDNEGVGEGTFDGETDGCMLG